MKTKNASNWSAAQSEEHYGFKRWGANHFSVDPEGFVQVQPLADGRNIRLLDVIEEARSMGPGSTSATPSRNTPIFTSCATCWCWAG